MLIPFDITAGQINQSYCSGYGRDGADSFWGSNANAHLSAAVKLDGNMLLGTDIAAIRFFLDTPPSMKDCQIFITERLDAAGRIYEQGFVPQNGWNCVWLDYPLSLDDYESLYIGYELTCAGEVIGIAERDDVIAGSDMVRNGNGSWESLSQQLGYPCELSLAAILTGGDYASYPATGIRFVPDTQLSTVKADDFFEIKGTIFNLGVNTLEGMKWECRVDGEESEFSGNMTASMLHYDAIPVSFPVKVSKGEHKIELFIMGDNDDTQEFSLSVGAYDEVFPKVALVEMFTSQYCSNCLAGKRSLDKVLHRSGANVVQVCHHAGFTDDYFTIPGSVALAEMYGVTTAPSMMLNRAPVFVGGTETVVFHPVYSAVSQFEDFDRANVLVGLAARGIYHNPDGLLEVEVTVGKDIAFDDPGMRLHVLVCENGVEGFQTESGAGRISVIHDHVPRLNLTPAVPGEAVVFDADGKFVAHYLVQLPETRDGFTGKPSVMVAGNLKIVAFISSDNASQGEGAVFNAAQSDVELSDEPGSGSIITTESDSLPLVYIKGNSVEVPAEGYEVRVYGVSGIMLHSVPPGSSLSLNHGYYIIESINGKKVKVCI